MKQTVSIIIPVYNVERYLAECLDSVCAQTYSALQIILIDDGSTDRSGVICDEYAQRDSRICVIHQQNAGAANAKNAGLDKAQGAYVTFADSDDCVDPMWIERMLAALVSSDADVAECDFTKWYVDREVPGSTEGFLEGVYSAEEYMRNYLKIWTSSLFWNKLFRAELTKDIRFRKERRCIDDEFYTYKVLCNAKKVVRIPNRLYRYRQRASGAVSNEKHRYQKTDDALEILMERYDWVRQRFPSVHKAFLCHDVEILFFIRTMDHNVETAKKFRRVARYYLWQVLRHHPNRTTVIDACKLQLISKRELLSQSKQASCVSVEEYFE